MIEKIDEGIAAYDAGDFVKALAIIKPLAEGGDAVAQYYLGGMLQFGSGIEASESDAANWFRKAAEQGHDKAQLVLGTSLLDAREHGHQPKEDLRWIRSLVGQVNEMAQCGLGEYCIDHNKTSEGIFLLSRVAEHGHDFNATSSAQTRLAEIYRKGDGVKRDVAEAVKWLRLSAEQGNDNSANDLAHIFYDGEGIPQDYTEAAKWFRQASGYEGASFQLGQMYLKGLGVPQDDVEAAKHFCLGADLMDSDCIAAFADLYKKGVTNPDCDCEIIKWYRKAMDEGDSDLQLYLQLRKPKIHEIFNKLNISAIGGLISLPALVWYDWILIARYEFGAERGTGWFYLILVTIFGFYLSGWLSKAYYQVNNYLRVTGFPFPVTLWERHHLGSDAWLNFDGLYTLVSPLLNACFLSLILVAIFLILPTEATWLFVMAVWIASICKFRVDDKKRRKSGSS